MNILKRLEESFPVQDAKQWADDIKHTSIIISAMYVFLVFAGQRIMKNKQALDLRMSLFLWNAILAVFSIVGALRVVENWLNSLPEGLLYSVCDNSLFTDHRTALWTFLFGLSKAYELGDTLFLVLRKRPIIFLHWYHHATVFIYAAYSYSEFASSGRWYMAMNYFIHSIMYSYYALMSLRLFRIPKVVSAGITSLQILQMVVGLSIATVVLFFMSSGVECQQTLTNVAFAWIMYLSYLVLFVQFFRGAYLTTTSTKKKSS